MDKEPSQVNKIKEGETYFAVCSCHGQTYHRNGKCVKCEPTWDKHICRETIRRNGPLQMYATRYEWLVREQEMSRAELAPRSNICRLCALELLSKRECRGDIRCQFTLVKNT